MWAGAAGEDSYRGSQVELGLGCWVAYAREGREESTVG